MYNAFEGLAGGKLKDRILSILTLYYPLPAKSVYNHLKKDYQITVSYQAVHKAIKEMNDEGILIADSKDYKISLEWLNKITEFASHIKEGYASKELLMNSIKVISFDLDGCLSDNAFDELIWRKKIPEIYAKEKGLSFDKGFEEVTKEYKRLWGKVEGWRDVEFWFKHFGFKTMWHQAIKEIEGSISHYGDVIPVLEELSRHFKLIIVSHADRKFIDLKIKVNNLGKYFASTYSTVSDFKEYKKNGEVFLSVCKKLDITPEQMIHIGDSYEYDYKVPTSVGVKSFIIDRIGTEKEKHIVRDLYEFKDRILQ